MRKEVDFKKSEKLHNKMITLSANISEEFDILETVEDNIKDIFNCDLDCSTCTEDDRAICMQTFKKGNFYWIRKIAQDEKMLQSIVEKMDEYREILAEATKFIRETVDIKIDESDESDEELKDDKSKKLEKRKKELKRSFKDIYS